MTQAVCISCADAQREMGSIVAGKKNFALFKSQNGSIQSEVIAYNISQYFPTISRTRKSAC